MTTTAIVPRWEWRTFGELGEAATRLESLPAERAQESDEVYVLSLDGDASVKVRDGLMDVKQLQQVDDDGLERWLPVLKASFPLTAAEVRTVLAALRAEPPRLGRLQYALQELVDEVVAPHDRITTVSVHKSRRHTHLDGCMAELTTLEAGGRRTATIALESEHATVVAAAVRKLGLETRPNVCLARGLKVLVGFEAHRYAVIDVGTNSVKFHVGEHEPDGSWRTVVDRAEVTRLGEALNRTGELGADPIERTVGAIGRMAAEARDDGAEQIAAVGTAGLRIAHNADAFEEAVEAACGVRVEVVSAEEEARLAYLAARTALEMPHGSLVVFDSGGGSSQFTFGHGDEVDDRFSLHVGSVRFTETFGLDGAVSLGTLSAALDTIASDLGDLDGRPIPDALVGMGGTLTNLASVKHALAAYDPEVVHGTVLDAAEIDRQIELYRTRSAAERRRVVGLQPGRSEVILAGACIVRAVLTKLRCDSLVVCDRGLRHGLLLERFGHEVRSRDAA